MKVELQGISKRFGTQWVLKNASCQFGENGVYGISGPNGSGKSTLIQIISGYLSPSQGKVHYQQAAQPIPREDIYRYLSIAAPYIDLIEDLTVAEIFQLCRDFGTLSSQLQWQDFLSVSELGENRNQLIKHLSSGRKQRLKVSLALCTDSPLLILDEPSSYFDRESKNWFYELLAKSTENKTVIIASNEEEDLAPCSKIIDVMDLK